MPAYVVLSDAHLNGIAARAPTTLAELARCAGIGPTKLERYGDEIVAVIADPSHVPSIYSRDRLQLGFENRPSRRAHPRR